VIFFGVIKNLSYAKIAGGDLRGCFLEDIVGTQIDKGKRRLEKRPSRFKDLPGLNLEGFRGYDKISGLKTHSFSLKKKPRRSRAETKRSSHLKTQLP